MTAKCEVDWGVVGTELVCGFQRPKLLIDGYEIKLSLFMHRGRPMIALYVNGEIDFASAAKDCEVRRRFFRKITFCLYRQKDQKKGLRILGKAWVEEHRAKYTMEFYEPFWLSLTALRRHLVKHNSLIRRI